jgi:alpha-tubulin suppressor-like RCC1 family protein
LNLQENGNIYSWGRNDQEQLGNKTKTNESKPVLVLNFKFVKGLYCGNDFSFILQNGEIWTCGRNDCGQLGLGDKINRSTFEKVKIDYKVKKFHAFGQHSIMLLGKLDLNNLLENGEVYTFGCNNKGQLGTGDELNLIEPIQQK